MFLFLLSLTGLVVNIVVLVPVFKLAFVFKKSPIYVISMVNISIDVINLIMATFYMAPSIIFETYIFGPEKNATIPKLLGSLFMFCWYLGSIAQMIMAINRLVVIYYRRNDLFTRHNLLILFAMITPICIFMTYMAQYGFPCCAFVFDQQVLSYSYFQIDDLPNYPNQIIDLPLNMSSTTIAFISYSLIVWTVRKSSKGVESSLSNMQNRRSRRNRELAYAMQFCFISMFYTFSWVCFRLFPVLIGNNGLEWFVSISTAVTINSSANAIVYLISNQEVRKHVVFTRKELFKRVVETSSNAHHSTDVPRSTALSKSRHLMP
ncbi:unnamed protein product [Caenorhabditis angaria]|uniref:7TM GPCR serpentine receptor class x (Srx) domain-containing protein n=1 Tax=Caenorhabditis angaria TaxID=860376 RepID=A0A9P1IVY2_9PELO|nr:unnamed protein product [Caenorhabditis angaria]